MPLAVMRGVFICGKTNTGDCTVDWKHFVDKIYQTTAAG